MHSKRLIMPMLALAATTATPAFGQRAAHLVDLPENVQTTQAAIDAVRGVAGDCELLLTRHYAVIYTGPLESARARADMLERGYNAYFTFTKRLRFDLAAPSHKLTVLVFDEQSQFNAYRAQQQKNAPLDPGAVLQGYYDPQTNRAAFFNQANSDAYRTTRQAYEQLAASLVAIPGPPETEIVVTTAAGQQVTTKALAAADLKALADELDAHFADENQQVTLHEGAHQLAFNSGMQSRDARYPFWVSEGLACVFETPSSKTTFGPYLVNLLRLKTYERARDAGRLLGLRRLVGGKDLEGADLFEVYAESWSLFYFLLRREPIKFRDYLHELHDRPHIADRDDAAAEDLQTFARFFGNDLDAVHAEWSRYMDQLIRSNEDAPD